MKSNQDLVISSLMKNNMSDEELSDEINISIPQVQNAIHYINFNFKKFKDFTILRSGKRKNYIRELSTKDSRQNDILNGRDGKIKKGLKQFEGAKKDGLIGMNTREGINNRNLLLNNILNQNLNAMITAQKLLQ